MLYIFANNMNVSDKLRIIRQSKGYTQDYVAEKLNIDPVNYGRIERGQTKLTIDRLQKLADIFEINIVEFFDEQSNQNLSETSDLLKKIYEIELKILKELQTKL